MASLTGCWQRNWILSADGTIDAKTRVWWVQGESFYADLRIPTDRPSFEGVGSLADCSPEQRQWLATQQGFAGKLGHVGDAFHWERQLDFQPPTGFRDIGRLKFLDPQCNVMVEHGVEQPYTEEWERIGGSKEPIALALQGIGAGRGLLVAVGEHFMVAIDRRSAGDVEISHGERIGAIENWIISESTFPWREGQAVLTDTDRWVAM